MAHRVKLLAEAIDEAAEARKWYESRSPSAAARFSEELDHAIECVADAPERWPEHLHGTRRYRLKRFPFVVVYRLIDDQIQVIAVQHASRRPGYWRTRLGRP